MKSILMPIACLVLVFTISSCDLKAANGGEQSQDVSMLLSEGTNLAQKRIFRSSQLIESLKNTDKEQIKTLLSGYESVSDDQVQELLDAVQDDFGDLSKATLEQGSIQLNKGDLDFIYHLQFSETQEGNWYLFKNENKYLRIGVLFGNGKEEVGALAVALVPAACFD